MRQLSSLVAAVSIVLLVTVSTHAQMAHRLKGSLHTTAGAPVANAAVRADNLAVTTAASGEFNITGIESGLWLFSSNAPGTIPAVMVLPVKFTARQQVSEDLRALPHAQ